MKISTIKLTFKGIETINEIYRITITDVKDAVRLLDGNIVALQHARHELSELLAIVDNKIATSKGYRLAKVDE